MLKGLLYCLMKGRKQIQWLRSIVWALAAAVPKWALFSRTIVRSANASILLHTLTVYLLLSIHWMSLNIKKVRQAPTPINGRVVFRNTLPSNPCVVGMSVHNQRFHFSVFSHGKNIFPGLSLSPLPRSLCWYPLFVVGRWQESVVLYRPHDPLKQAKLQSIRRSIKPRKLSEKPEHKATSIPVCSLPLKHLLVAEAFLAKFSYFFCF
jgi:hypothetical protein